MKNTLLSTKLQPPPVAPDIIRRDQLIALLKHGRYRPLTLISAPAGYGKSTLGSLWAGTCESPCGWVSLDPGDNDLRKFLSYILAAIKQLFQVAVWRTESLLEADRLPQAAELALYLLNDLQQVDGPFTLILDDYHHITEATVRDFVAALLEHPSQYMHLMLLTRVDPSLPVAAMRGRGLLNEIRESDLRLTPDEVVDFMNRIPGFNADNSTASILESKTEGWAAGLRLTGYYLQGCSDQQKKVEDLDGNSDHIAEYLLSEVLSKQSDEMITFLVETSILDRFCIPLCSQFYQKGDNENSGQHDVGVEKYIQWLKESHLFVVALDDKSYWFRYHHLFHDFLKGQLSKRVNTERVAELHRIAGGWFAKNNLIEDAIQQWVKAGEISKAEQLIIEHRHTLMNSSQFTSLNHWINILPEDSQANNPLLMTTRSFISMEQGNYADARLTMMEARRMLESVPSDSDEYGIINAEIVIMQSIVDILVGSADSSDSNLREAFDALPKDSVFMRALEVTLISYYLQVEGNKKEAVSVIKKACSIPDWPSNIQARLHFHQCLMLYMSADLNGIMNTLEECRQTIEHRQSFHTRAYHNYFYGVAKYFQNDLSTAKKFLLKVLDDRHTANSAYVADAGFILACIFLSLGESDAADQVIERIRSHCLENNYTRVVSIINAFDAEFAIRQGDIQKAFLICMDADFEARKPLWFFYVTQLTPVKCQLALGTEDSLEEALSRLVRLEEKMNRLNRINVRIEALALLALLHYRREEMSTACKYLLTALELAAPNGWVRSFVDLGEDMVALLEHFLENRPDKGFAQRILQACQAENLNQNNALAEDVVTGAWTIKETSIELLTRRETEILPFLTEGLSNKEIAGELGISEGTAKTHLRNIFKKLNVNSRIETINKLHKSGLMMPPGK